MIESALTGYDLIHQPMLNKGTAFSNEERAIVGLHELLPPHVGVIQDQIKRRLRAIEHPPASFEQYAFLRELQDTHESLFYALLAGNIERILPLVDTSSWGRVKTSKAQCEATSGSPAMSPIV